MDALYQNQLLQRESDEYNETPWPPQTRTDPYKVTTWKGHPRRIRYFKWNPKYMTAVSAAQHVALWLPKNAQYENVRADNSPQQGEKKSNLKKTTSP